MFLRAKQQIIIIVAAGMMLSGFIFFVNPSLEKKAKTIESETAMTKLIIEEVTAQKEQLPMLKKHLEQLQVEAEGYELKLPVERELGSFLHQIADLMNNHNLKNQFVEPGKEVETEKLNCIPVDMRCSGKLPQIFEFYKSLQNLNRLIRVENVKLESKNSSGGEVNMETKAVIYYQPMKLES